MKSFASEYDRTDEGWIKFPTDADYRKRMFPLEVNKHTAKANVYLVQSIIEYVSEAEQTLMDIMAGTGTIIVGALVGRDIICVEISPYFHQLQQSALIKLEQIAPGISGHVSLINIACQTYLPIPNLVDHIIFSPPYASIMKSKGKDKLTTEMSTYDMAEYTFTSPLNVGLMNDWIWGQEMKKIYRKCYDTIKPGGTLSIIVKDHMEKRKRVPLSQAAADACIAVGFELESWHKWNAPGSFYTSIYRARGWEVVEDEDIIILKKGG